MACCAWFGARYEFQSSSESSCDSESSDDDFIEDLTENFDISAIQELFKEVSENMYCEQEFSGQELALSINNLCRYHSQAVNGRSLNDMDYNDFHNRLGYLTRYAVCHSAVVQLVTTAMLQRSSEVALSLSDKTTLNVVSLGSGPGNDVIGLLLGLRKWSSSLWRRIYVNVTAVDKMAEWEETFNDTFAELIPFFDVASCEFVEADLSLPTFQLDEKLMHADWVLLVKVVSVLSNYAKLSVLKYVVQTMKPGSLLFFMDSPFPTEMFAALKDYVKVIYKCSKRQYFFEKLKNSGSISSCRMCVRVFKIRSRKICD